MSTYVEGAAAVAETEVESLSDAPIAAHDAAFRAEFGPFNRTFCSREKNHTR